MDWPIISWHGGQTGPKFFSKPVWSIPEANAQIAEFRVHPSTARHVLVATRASLLSAASESSAPVASAAAVQPTVPWP